MIGTTQNSRQYLWLYTHVLLLTLSVLLLAGTIFASFAFNETLSSANTITTEGYIQIEKNVTIQDIGQFDTIGITFARAWNKTGTHLQIRLINTGPVLLTDVNVHQSMATAVPINYINPEADRGSDYLNWEITKMKRSESFTLNLSANGSVQFSEKPVITYTPSDIQVSVKSEVSRLEPVQITLIAGNQPLAGINVMVFGPNGNEHSYVTDDNGIIIFVPLGVGNYTYKFTGIEMNWPALNTEVFPSKSDIAAAAAPPPGNNTGNETFGLLMAAAGGIGLLALILFAALIIVSTREGDGPKKLTHDMGKFEKTAIDIVPIKSEPQKVIDIELGKEKERMRDYLKSAKTAKPVDDVPDESSGLIKKRKEKMGVLPQEDYAPKEQSTFATSARWSESAEPNPEFEAEEIGLAAAEILAQREKEAEAQASGENEKRLAAAGKKLQQTLDGSMPPMMINTPPAPIYRASAHVAPPKAPAPVRKRKPAARAHAKPIQKSKPVVPRRQLNKAKTRVVKVFREEVADERAEEKKSIKKKADTKRKEKANQKAKGKGRK